MESDLIAEKRKENRILQRRRKWSFQRLKNKKGYNLTPTGIVGSGEGIKENS